MEVIGVTASIIAILHITHRVSTHCLDIHSTSKHARPQITRILDEVNSLRSLLESLARLDDKDNSNPVLLHLRAILSPGGLLESCSEELKDLEAELSRLAPSKPRFDHRVLMWVLKEKDINIRLDRISRVNQSLQLALNVDQTVLLLEARTHALQLSSAVENDSASRLRRSIIDWLGTPFPTSTVNDAQKVRCPDSGKWLLDGAPFNEWKQLPASVMWLHGIPGSGKTVLCSSVIEQLSQNCRSQGQNLLIYFFFDFSAKGGSVLLDFLRTLLSQIVVQRQSVSGSIHTLYTNHHEGFQQPSEKALLETLRMALVDAGPVYFVMDALDECCERAGLLAILEQITQWRLHNLHIMATSRSESDIEEVFCRLKAIVLHMEGQDVRNDIEMYVRTSVSQDRRLGRWSSDVKREIVEVVSQQAGEMFRWANCQLEALRKCRNIKELHIALNTLPSTLDETYARILDTIDPFLGNDAFKILCWLCFAFRAPTLEDLTEILAVDVDHLTYDPDQRIQDVNDVLLICGSLVTQSEPGSVLRLAHYSVKEYLMSDRILKSRHSHYHIEQHAADKFIATICLVHLQHHYEKTRTRCHPELPSTLLKYSLDFWSEHFKEANSMSDLLPLAMNLLVDSGPGFLNWAWISGYSARGFYSEAPNNNHGTELDVLLYYAAMIGSPDLMKALLVRGANINAISGEHGTPLIVASIGRHLGSMEFLLGAGADVNAAGVYSPTALHAAAICGWREGVELLIKHGADENAHGSEFETPLVTAVRYSAIDTVRLLLSAGANPNISWIYNSPLWHAADQNNDAIVDLLLEHGANPNERNGYILDTVLERGYLSIADILIMKGANLYPKDGSFNSPLSAAARGGLTSLQLLIDKYGVDHTITDAQGRTALHSAAQGTSVETIEYLIKLGLDPNQKDAKGWTALHYAAQTKDEKNIRMLLPHMNPNPLADNNTWTPLHLACRTNNVAALQLLWDSGHRPTVVTTTEPQWQWTPYDIALAHGNQSIVSPSGQVGCPEFLLGPLNEGMSQAERAEHFRHMSTHTGVSCDACEMMDIMGPAFHCQVCPDFDYCFVCWHTAEKAHPHSFWNRDGVVEVRDGRGVGMGWNRELNRTILS